MAGVRIGNDKPPHWRNFWKIRRTAVGVVVATRCSRLLADASSGKIAKKNHRFGAEVGLASNKDRWPYAKHSGPEVFVEFSN